MKNLPQTIYLQTGGSEVDDFNELSDVTYCVDPINNDDAVYDLRQPFDRTADGVWLPFAKPYHDHFDKAAKANALVLYDDGSVLPYRDEEPFAKLTHFYYDFKLD